MLMARPVESVTYSHSVPQTTAVRLFVQAKEKLNKQNIYLSLMSNFHRLPVIRKCCSSSYFSLAYKPTVKNNLLFYFYSHHFFPLCAISMPASPI